MANFNKFPVESNKLDFLLEVFLKKQAGRNLNGIGVSGSLLRII